MFNYFVQASHVWFLDSGCSRHMTGNKSILTNFHEEYFGTVKFGNNHFAAITGSGNLVYDNVTITNVSYVEGLNHNLFSIGQLCDKELEVNFTSTRCVVRHFDGREIITGRRQTNLYTINLSRFKNSNNICLLSRASSVQSWLWHRRLSHLNFNNITKLAVKGLVKGLPNLRFEKDKLCYP